MSHDPVHLFDVSHTEARRLLAIGAPVFLTINPVEYHGPHLPLHTDRLISRGLVRDLFSRLSTGKANIPLLVADDLEIGVAPTPGPASRATSYPDACKLVREACRALVEMGARRVVLMTFHGAPLHNLAIEEGIDELTRAGVRAVAPFNRIMRLMLRLDSFRFADALSHIEDAEEREHIRRGFRFDFHGGFFETSILLHYAPHAVDPLFRTLPPCPSFTPNPRWLTASRAARMAGQIDLANEFRFAAWAYGWNELRPFPGYTGSPHRATEEAGAKLSRALLDECEAVVEAVFAGAERSPEPIMRWTASATLGGRLAQLDRWTDAIKPNGDIDAS